jgi:NAD-dependent deacetylase
MRPIADYVEELSALGKRILAISAEAEADSYSTWWDVCAFFRRQPAANVRPVRWIEYQEFDSHVIDLPGVGIEDWQKRDAAERAAAVEFGRALAAALRVPFYVAPPDDRGRHLSWFQQSQSAQLRDLLDRARHVLVVSGREFCPVGSQRSIPYRDLLASDDARKRYWDEKIEDWERIERWKSTQAAFPPDNPYRALADLDRRGIIEGVVVETPFGHLQVAGVGSERLVEIHGSLAEVECLRCRKHFPATGAIDDFRSTGQVPRCPCGGFLKSAVVAFGQKPPEEALARARWFASRADLVLVLGSRLAIKPCRSIVLDPVRTRNVPLVIVGHEATGEDANATLVINGMADAVLPFTINCRGVPIVDL